eukprot:590969-Prymnesium_polylepis.1
MALQQMRVAVQSLEAKVGDMQITLPKAVAEAVPHAVRMHDEEQSAEVRKQVLETGLGAILKQIEQARSMQELSQVEGIRWNPHENSLSCLCCEAHRDSSGIKGSTGA